MISTFLFIFVILSLILFIKAALFWVYLWQVKEYRLDRFWAEYGKPPKLFRFWIFSGGRKIWKPKWTTKAILIFLLSILIIGALSIFGSISRTKSVSPVLPIFLPTTLLIFLGIYLFIPIVVSSMIFLFKIPTALIKKNIYRQAAANISSIKNLTVIGITGSYGKSSTKEFLVQILSQKFKIAKTPANINSEIGIAEFILKDLPTDAEIFIVEMGAYRIGEIRRICNIVKPKIGILTGINEQHLALFGSLESIKKAKLELIESLPQDGLAVFNGENKYTSELAGKWERKKIVYHDVNLLVRLASHGGRRSVDAANIINIPRHYLLNLAGAIEVAKYLGMNDGEIEKALENVKFTGRTIKTFTGKNSVLIIDDIYSANPSGVIAALDYLKEQPQKTKIIVMPCLIELGKAASEVHQRIGQRIAEVCDLAIIATPDYFEDIKKEAGNRVILETNSQKVIELLKTKLNQGTAILLEGRLSDAITNSLK